MRTLLRYSASTALVFVGWAAIFVLTSHPWASFVEHGTVVGWLGLLGSDILRAVPRYAYFTLVGFALGHVYGPLAGARLALWSAAIAMVADTLLEKMIFNGGIDAFALLLLTVNYIVPPLLAAAAAAATGLWRKPPEKSIAT
jgi:hypothetical protein